MNVDKIYQEVKAKFDSTEFSTRATTINSDLERYFIKTYQVLGDEGDLKGKPLPGMTFVTGNQPQVWANHCMSILTSQDPKIRFFKRDANLTDDQMELLRNWWATIYYLSNQEAEGKAILPIHQYMAWSAVLTDAIIPRVIIDTSGKEPRYDIQIANTESVCWAKGKNGVKWVAYRYEKSKDEILDEYPSFKISTDVETITEWWGYDDGKVVQIVYIGDKAVAGEGGVIRDWSASMDTLPCSINPVLLNPAVKVDGKVQSSGASVYWGARTQFDEQNRAKSVKATLLMREAAPAIKHKSLGTSGEPGSPLERYPVNGEVVEMGNAQEDITPVFTNTTTALQAVQIYDEDCTKQIEQGTATDLAYGGQDYSHMPTSLWDRRTFQMGKVLYPRRKAMEVAYKAIFNKMFEQFVKLGLKLQVETEKGLSDQTVTASDLEKLKDKFKVEFEVTSIEPSGDITKFQKKMTADQAGVDPDWSDENILDYPDLTRVKENRVKAQAKALDPTLYLFEDYAIACKELDMMEAGPMKDMKAMEIKYRKANLELLAKQAVSGGENVQR